LAGRDKGRSKGGPVVRLLSLPLRVVAPQAVIERCEWPTALAAWNDAAFEATTPDAGAGVAAVQRQRNIVTAAFAEVASIFERLANPVCVSVADSSGPVVRIAMRRTVFHPGETIAGACDMSTTPFGVLCHSFRATLETEELLDTSSCWDQRRRRPSPRIVAEQQVVTASCDIAPFALAVPHDACHEFSSTEVAVRWLLVFRFRLVAEGCSPNGPTSLPPPGEVHFALPVHVLDTAISNQPCRPIFAVRHMNL